jgi:hypothetical protein
MIGFALLTHRSVELPFISCRSGSHRLLSGSRCQRSNSTAVDFAVLLKRRGHASEALRSRTKAIAPASASEMSGFWHRRFFNF